MNDQPRHKENRVGLSPLNGYRIKKTIKVLIHQIDSIPNVKSWARQSKVSRGWLYKSTKEYYGLSPKEILCEVRYEKIIQLLQNDVEATCYSIAKESGLSSEDALRMFLKRHWDTNFRKLRRKILTGAIKRKWKWLQKE